MKSKIAIITLYGNYNFGNKLQNLALQQTLESMEYDVETLVLNEDGKINKETKIKSVIQKLIKINVPFIMKKIDHIIYRKSYRKIDNEREMIFMKFSDDYLNVRKVSIMEFENIAVNYDFFVIGSDQVWNPNFIENYEFSFAQFAQSQKKVVYGASLGVDRIEERFFPEYKKGLAEMNKISVREDQGKLLLKKQFGLESTVVVDPTLLLLPVYWKRLIEERLSGCEKNKPIVTLYFLGNNTKYPLKELELLCENKGLQIIDLSRKKNNNDYVNGPIEFINLINQSQLFLTDSFHGSVFSVLFHTPFIVFKRDNESANMFARLDNLLTVFQMKERIYDSKNSLLQYMECSFDQVDEIQNKLKKESMGFLEDALNIE